MEKGHCALGKNRNAYMVMAKTENETLETFTLGREVRVYVDLHKSNRSAVD
jgi:hypothetical protein